MNHSFNIEIAKKVGVNAAIIYENIIFWCIKNKANDKNKHDGKYWTYNSVRAWREIFPYMSDSQIKTALKKLKDALLIEVGEHNSIPYDRTRWYSPIDLSEIANGEDENRQPIPVINTSINTVINKESVATAPKPSLPKQKKKVMYTDEDMGLAYTMYHNILAMNEGFKAPDLEVWANEFRLMREIDNREVYKMDNFLNSLATDDNIWAFWRGNILSPKSMRKNYDTVVSQYRRDVVNMQKAVNQDIPIANRMEALANSKKTDVL